MSIKTDALIVGGIALAVLAMGYYAKRQIGNALGAVGDAVAPVIPYINPADSQNVINQGVAWVGASMTGNAGWTLGGALYDQTHDGRSLTDLVNPTSRDNVIYSWDNYVGATLTGDKNWTLGGQIYDWTH
jgi:hypothetical protein